MEVKPTRSELMQLKEKIKLAKSGYNLLKKKRDGLILEFFEILKKVKSLRAELTEEYNKAVKRINLARIIESDLQIKSIAMAIAKRPEVHVERKNIMGVVVPKIQSEGLVKNFDERGYGLFSGAAINEAAEAFEKVVEKIIVAAEVETTMKKMLNEIEKTKRRVNALEFSVIPGLENTAAFIRLRLEEMERENIFCLKRIKKSIS